MTLFDTSLAPDAIEEQQSTPILPEERFIFELIGFERSGPDKYRKDGGVKWSFLVYDEHGQPFIFDDKHYVFWRNTGLTRTGKPNFNIGTHANMWASALLGRDLGVDADFSISELHQKRMSAMVTWEPQRDDPKKKSIKLASFRHVPVGSTNRTAPAAAPPLHPAEQITADASDEDVDRALSVSKIQKSLARLKKLDEESGERAQAAVDKFDLDTAPLEALDALSTRISASIMKAIND